MDSNKTTLLTENATLLKERIIAHEVGHYFGLAARSGAAHDNAPLTMSPKWDASIHQARIDGTKLKDAIGDNAKLSAVLEHPEFWGVDSTFIWRTVPLMRAGPDGPSGAWTRWEDWLMANQKARQFFPSSF